MADIPTANVSLEAYNVVGNQVECIYKVTGDASGVTIPTHVGRIIACFTQPSTESDGYAPAITFATNIVTYGTAPSSGLIHYLLVRGTA